MVKLFVVGFPRDMDEAELTELFGAHGAVEKTLIITDPHTNKSKGYGFIDMADASGADEAIAALDGASIDARVISVRIKEEKQAPQRMFSTTQHNRQGPAIKADAPSPAAKKKRPRL